MTTKQLSLGNTRIASLSLTSRHWYGIGALLILGLIAYGLGLLTPVLISDDWAMAAKWNIERSWQCPQWVQTRPFRACYNLILYDIFGLNVVAFNIASFVMNVGLAALLYLILHHLNPRHRLFNLMVAMLFLVYPTDFTRNWISANSLKFASLFFFPSVLLFVIFWRGGRWWTWLVGLFLLAISLWIYETHVGLTLAGSVALFLFGKHQSRARRWAILGPALVAVFYVLWFMYGTSLLGIKQIYSPDLVTLSPAILITRMIAGYRIQLQWGWTELLLHFFPGLAASGSHVNLWATLVLGGGVGLGLLLAALIARFWIADEPSQAGDSGQQRSAALKRFALLAVGGLAAIGAGYIPLISAFGIWIDYEMTRYNSLPSIGAAIFLAAVLGFLATLIARTARQATFIFVISTLMLVIFGTAGQMAVQKDTLIAWQEQKLIMQQLFELAPDIKDDTGVYVMAPGYRDTLGPRPFTDGPLGLGFSAALAMAYDNNTLHGAFNYDDLKPPQSKFRFTDEGLIRVGLIQILGHVGPVPQVDPNSEIHPAEIPVLIPYEQMLVFRYHPETRQLTLLDGVPEDWLDGARPQTELGFDRILPEPPENTELRKLVY